MLTAVSVTSATVPDWSFGGMHAPAHAPTEIFLGFVSPGCVVQVARDRRGVVVLGAT
jgi:hypothetical protein